MRTPCDRWKPPPLAAARERDRTPASARRDYARRTCGVGLAASAVLKDGLSDIALQLFLSPEKSGKFIWGAGPAFVFPTATDKIIGTEKWSAGPAVVGAYTSGPWVVGAIVNQLWSFAGDDGREHHPKFEVATKVAQVHLHLARRLVATLRLLLK